MDDNSRLGRYKHRISRLLKRLPWIMPVAIRLIQRTRPRFTAGVIGVVQNEKDEVLLVEHVFHVPDAWGLPGGWIERRESPLDALKRELREELGLQVEVLQPLLIQPAYRSTHLDIAFVCRAKNDVQHVCAELLDYRWAAPDDLPPMPFFHRAAVEAATARQVSEEYNR